jgi:hypothetical protein
MSTKFYFCDECGYDSGGCVSRFQGDWHDENCSYYRKPFVDWDLNPDEAPAWYVDYRKRRFEEIQKQEMMKKVEAIFKNKKQRKP